MSRPITSWIIVNMPWGLCFNLIRQLKYLITNKEKLRLECVIFENLSTTFVHVLFSLSIFGIHFYFMKEESHRIGKNRVLLCYYRQISSLFEILTLITLITKEELPFICPNLSSFISSWDFIRGWDGKII